MPQHPCLVQGLEAFNRVSERLLELDDYGTGGGLPRQSRPPLLRLGGERRGEETKTHASQERATVYHWMRGSSPWRLYMKLEGFEASDYKRLQLIAHWQQGEIEETAESLLHIVVGEPARELEILPEDFGETTRDAGVEEDEIELGVQRE